MNYSGLLFLRWCVSAACRCCFLLSHGFWARNDIFDTRTLLSNFFSAVRYAPPPFWWPEQKRRPKTSKIILCHKKPGYLFPSLAPHEGVSPLLVPPQKCSPLQQVTSTLTTYLTPYAYLTYMQPKYTKVKVQSTQDKQHNNTSAEQLCRAMLQLPLPYKRPCHC